MSVIIKGINLPKNQTIIIHYADKYGEMETVFVGENNIIQIPKDHGRLIDVSRLYPSILEKLEYGGSDGRAVYRRKFQAYTEKDIENAPTILGMEE